MSKGIITREYTIWCNSETCHEWEQDAMVNSAKEMEDISTCGKYGWRKIRGKFYCPKCAGTKKPGRYDDHLLDLQNPLGEAP